MSRDSAKAHYTKQPGDPDEGFITASDAQAAIDDIYDDMSAPAVIAEGSVTSGKIAADAVGSAQIATGAVGSGELATDAVTSDKIADGAVSNAHVASDAAIAASKVAGTAVTQADTGTVTNGMLAGSIAKTKVAGTAITAADTGTVTGTMIAAGAVDNGNLAANAVNEAKIASGAVTTVKIADDAVTSDKIADNAVTAAQIAANAVGASELADNAVDTAAIAADAVTADKIANDTITAAKLDPTTTGVYNVRAFGATGDGVADDTAAIQSAIDAVHANGGGVVHVPQGTYRITGDGLQSRSAMIVGAGARSGGTSTAKATILQGDSQTGPVLTIEGSGGIGEGGYVDQFFGMRGVEGLTIRGDGTSNECGLYLHNAHMITVRNVAIRNCRGVPLYSDRAYFVTVDDCQIQEPVGAATNDTYYVHLRQVNSWRVRGLLLRLSTATPTVGASGAVLITHNGSFDSTSSDFHILTEYMTLAEGSLGIIDHRGNGNRIELTAWDSEDHGSVTTPWAAIKMSPGLNDYGGNTVVGNLLAKYPAGSRTCYGVRLGQGNNAVLAVPGYPNESVYIASGVQHCRIELLGSQSGPSTGQVVDASGNSTNHYVDILTARFAQTSMGFFGASPIAKPTVTGSRGGNAALASALTALANLGLITDSSS